MSLFDSQQGSRNELNTICRVCRRRRCRRTRGRSSRGSRITGRTGPSSEGGTVSTSGPTLLHWSSPTAPTAGSGSSWMGSWPPCILVGVQRAGPTVLVGKQNTQKVLFISCRLCFADTSPSSPPEQSLAVSSWRSCSGRGVR